MSDCPFPVFKIEGNAIERGQQYGSQCKDLIGQAVAIYRQIFKDESDLNWEQSLEKAKEFTPFIREYDAEIMEEIEGMAEGSGRPVEEILALNVRSELRFLLTAEGKKGKRSCTSLAVTPDATASKHMLVAQNWDWHVKTQDLCVILEIKQKGRPNIVQVVEAGIIAKIGFNSAGIGLCTNALISEKWRVGVPFHAILRRILNAETMAEAIGAVTSPHRASSGNYLIGHVEGEAIDIEAAPDHLNYIFPDCGIITHSNHFKVANTNIKDLVPSLWPDTIMRDYRAGKILARSQGKIDIDFIQQVLRDHFDKPNSICSHPGDRPDEQEQTNLAFIIDLNEKAFHIAKGPTCEHDFVKMDCSHLI